MHKVEQIDREAAAHQYLALVGPPFSPADVAMAAQHQAGHFDTHESVQAFAAHRLAERASMSIALRKSDAALITLRDALEYIAEEHDAGRHDGLPEPCPAHDGVTMWAIARAALTAIKGGDDAA